MVSDRSSVRLLPARPFTAAAVMILLTALLYVAEFYNLATGNALDQRDCIMPGDPTRLDAILFAPMLHANWDHLDGNAPYFLVFGFLVMAGGFGRFLAVTAIVWLTSGIGVWFFGTGCTLGASGVIFGWLVYLLFRGFFAGSARQIGLALVLLFFWGGLLLGILPGQPEVSWQAHLFGALGGILAARLVTRRPRYDPPAPPRPRPRIPEGPVIPE
jgi:membrane associated rhomboid family serine protease